MTETLSSGIEKPEEKKEPVNPQSLTDQGISSRLWLDFDKWRRNRNLSWPQFRNRTIYEYLNDNNQRFNNYRIKPAWKEEWQANISDITMHAKLMSIVAGVVQSNFTANFSPRNKADMISQIKCQLKQDLYEYTETEVRNGKIDLLMTCLNTAREGTCIGFEGWKKSAMYEGIDAQFVPLEDWYPADMTKFFMKDQYKAVWRSVITKDDFDDSFHGCYQFDKVKIRSNVNTEERQFFNISDDIVQDQVEILRRFDLLNDEYFVTVNGVNIIKPGDNTSKLSIRRKGRVKTMGFWKTVFEMFPNFFYGRAFPDLLKDNQDAIDFLFNGMFDSALVSVMKPIIYGGTNSLTSDYWFPGRPIQVSDINQIKELQISGPDIVSFKILQELQKNNIIASFTDDVSSGVATGRKTATEVERSQEQAKKIHGLFGTMIADAIEQKAKLRVGTILQYMVKSPIYKDLILNNVNLPMQKATGTKVLRVRSQNKMAPKDQFGHSPQLFRENAMIQGKSEIWEFDPKELEDEDFSVKVTAATTIDQSPALKRAFLDRLTTKYFAMPNVFNPIKVAQIDVDNNKDVLGPNTDGLINESQGGAMPGQEGGAPGAGNPVMDQLNNNHNQSAIPKLKSLIGQ